jgi:3-phosphoshikimate 1-carboxyvinyltransferase
MIIKPANALQGTVSVPGDKSISHRAVMFGAISEGDTTVRNFLRGADCMSTISCFRQLGIPIDVTDKEIIIHGKGLGGLQKSSETLDTGNSGTTTRLISGILSGQPFETTINGDASIQKRPMKRIFTPLSQMGASFTCHAAEGCAPYTIHGGSLKGIHYDSPIASAQVKSCVLLAGLYADSETSVTEPAISRDHSERMLSAFGADITRDGLTVTIQPHPHLTGQQIDVPGDISSAAYFIAAGLLCPNSDILIRNVGINPTRDGIIRICREMSADLTLENEQTVSGEPVADIRVRTSHLHAVTIEGEIIPTLIDEIPMIAVMACFAEGTTIIRDAADLKAKESNRIETVVTNLKAMGADITATDDGMIIRGTGSLHGAKIQSYDDHRIAMSFAIAALCAEGNTDIENAECVNISYPRFYEDLQKLQK